MAVLGSQVDLAHFAQASQVLMGITVWVAVAPTLEPPRVVRNAVRRGSTTMAALGPTMELAHLALVMVGILLPISVITISAAAALSVELPQPALLAPRQDSTTVDVVSSPVELAHLAQATQVLMGITVWAAVALTLEPVRYVRIAAAHLDSTIVDVLGPAVALAHHAQATKARQGFTV